MLEDLPLACLPSLWWFAFTLIHCWCSYDFFIISMKRLLRITQMLPSSIFLGKFLHSKKALETKEGNKYNKEGSFVFPCRISLYWDIYLLGLLHFSLFLFQQVVNVSAALFCRRSIEASTKAKFAWSSFSALQPFLPFSLISSLFLPSFNPSITEVIMLRILRTKERRGVTVGQKKRWGRFLPDR